MKKYASYTFILALLGLTFAACEDVEENVIPHIASPVLLETTDLSTEETLNQVQATFYELDKSGILDNSVGIDSIPIANLPVQVFSGETLVGEYTTDGAGSFIVEYDPSAFSDGLEWAGTYNDIAFRIRK